MSSTAGLKQADHIALLKVRVPVTQALDESDARERVQRYLFTGQVVFSTLDDTTDYRRPAWVVTALVQGWDKSVETFKTYGVTPQVDRFASSGYLVVTESTVYTPEA